MSEQIPNLHQEMNDVIEGAREATDEGGRHSQHGRLEIMSANRPNETPGLNAHQVSQEVLGQVEMTGAVVEKRAPNTEVEYRANVISDKEGKDLFGTGVTVERIDTRTGEKYSHRFENPDTARKFIKLIGNQVIKRANNNIAENETRKAA